MTDQACNEVEGSYGQVAEEEEWWGQKVSLNFLFFRPEEIEDSLRATGFVVEEIVLQDRTQGVGLT
jgi:hypothetical protein